MKKSLPVLFILAAGLLAALWILRPEQRIINFDNGISSPNDADVQGPHGGKILAQGDLQLEVTIYEREVPPQFRVYVSDARGQELPLKEVQLEILLKRLDRTDRIGFRPSGAYLLGDGVVSEPHSFDVTVNAQWQGQSYTWTYSGYEARAQISDNAAQQAGIVTAKAGPATLRKIEVLPGEIGLHEKRIAHVVPRVDARVLNVNKDLGDPVKVGEVLAVLESRELADAKSIYLNAVKKAEPARINLDRQKTIYSNTVKMLEVLEKHNYLDRVREELDDLLLGESRALLIPAYARYLRSQAIHERERILYEKKISSRSEYLSAQEEFKSAEARYRSLREQAAYQGKMAFIEKRRIHEMAQLEIQTTAQKLTALGLNDAEIKNLSRIRRQNFTKYEIRAPIEGEVIQKHITVGEAVKKDSDIFFLADLNEVWVNIAVPAKDLNIIKLGQQLRVKSENLGLEATGQLTYLGSIIDQKTRTVTGRVVIANKDRRWRPGMYVTIDLVEGEQKVPLAVPVEAIQTLRGWSVVFIKVGTLYEARPLELGNNDGKWVEVKSGLSPGTEYVRQNSFAVKAEISKSTATHSH